MNIPIISLEIQGMRQSLKVALMEHQLKISSELNDAVDRYCSEGNVARIVKAEAIKCMDEALREEVKSFFGWSGPGRRAIKDAVRQRMEELYPERDGA